MTAGTHIPLGGGVSVDALLDAVADHPRRLEDAFAGVPATGWEAVAGRHPETVGADGRWRLPVFTYLIRTPSATVLVDAGVGPQRTVAAEWLGVTGSLPELLAAVGVDAGAVDLVFFTHLHEDHVGWGADPETGDSTFPAARYALTETEWETERRRGIRRHVEDALGPAGASGRLETVAPGELSPGLEVVALPGHTAGHAGIRVRGDAGSVLVAGDAFNHPAQISEPDIASGADADAETAARTRRLVLDSLYGDGPDDVVASAHLPGGWWRSATEREQGPSTV